MTKSIAKIRQKFSEAAAGYDEVSGFHRQIADELWEMVAHGTPPSRILDIGCGTGYLTIRLKEHFPDTKIIGLDFAEGMLNVAGSKNDSIDWVLGDAHHLPFGDGEMDVVVSNLSYQWVEDLSAAFREAQRVLKPGGIFACSLFGFYSCKELFLCLDEAKKGVLEFDRLPTEEQAHQALQAAGFSKHRLEVEESKSCFADMYSLLIWLKTVGANHMPRRGFIGSRTLAKADALYCQKFSNPQGIEASFEVFDIYAQK